MQDPKILIVGAGPSGLVSSIHLHRSGVMVDLVDARWSIDPKSKALSMNSATLETLFDLGVGERVLDEGVVNDTIEILWKKRPLQAISLRDVRTPFPFFLMLPQFRTEVILADRLAELGGTIRRGVQVVDLVPEDDGYLVTLEEEGAQVTRHYDYVLGCDGANSTVRSKLEILFPVSDYDMHFAMCDAVIDWPGHSGRWQYIVDEYNFMILIPLSGDSHRIVIKLDGLGDRRRRWIAADFEAFVARMGLEGFRIQSTSWTSAARFQDGLADSFRAGRAFLVGDAAHRFSPIGGQGMNTGVQDAYNLAYKLAMVLRGDADPALLDSYESERREWACNIGDSTRTMTRLIAGLDRDPRGPLRGFLPSSAGGEYLTQTLPSLLSGVSARYGLNGAAIQRVALPHAGPLHDSEGRRDTLVLHQGVTECRATAGALSGLAEELGLGFIATDRRDVREELCSDVHDAPVPIVGLVRPDRFLAWRQELSSAEDVHYVRVKLLRSGTGG